MFKIPIKYFSRAIFGVLSIFFAGISTITYADTLARQVIAAGGDQVTVGSNTLGYTLGQPFISTNTSTQLLSGFWNGLRRAEPSPLVELVAIVSASPVCLDEPFDVTFQMVAADSQPVDGVQVYLKFDPTKLQVNDISNSGALDFTLLKDFSNTEGYVHFAASSFFQPPPSGSFELVTVNFTALEESAGTLLQVDPENSTSKFEGNYLPQSANDTALVVNECINCKVNLQGRAAKPDDSWITDLDIHTEEIQSITSDNMGYCILPATVSLGNQYFCVKNSHTLANKVGSPVVLDTDDRVDLGTLLEGDINNDNSINLDDIDLIKPTTATYNKCVGQEGYNANADLNADACVNFDDVMVGFGGGIEGNGNFGKPSACHWDNTTQTLRKGLRKTVRDGNSGIVTLQTTAIPAGLTVDATFDIAIQVSADVTQSTDGIAVYLNFDPDRLQVNHLNAGDKLDFILQKSFDNTLGHINFAATVWDGELPTGNFTVVTINFTLLNEGGEKTLSFNTTAHRSTEAVSGGESVIIPGQEGEIIFEEDEVSIAPASCQLYAVHDGKLNHSQFFTVTLDDHKINELGQLYKGYDIEAIAIHPETNMMYAASGDNVSVDNLQGHFYQVDGQNGQLIAIGSTGFNEIEDLAFSADGTLWAWAKGDGLITIDLTTGAGTLVIPSDVLIEGLTLSKDNNTVFYGAVNTELWIYDMNANTLDIACTNLLGETEALEMMSGDLMLIGVHKDKTLNIHVFDPKTCQVIVEADIPTNKYNDVEGIALPVDACTH